MGEIVAAACVSHSPGLTGFPDRAELKSAENVFGAFSELSTAIRAARPDAIVAISSEHFTNFFLSNLPTFAIGTADAYELPATDPFSNFLKIPRHPYPGHPSLGEEIYRGLLEREFDPALVAGDYGFDESFAVPLTLLVDQAPIPVVPILVNAIHPPCPTLRRCYGLGTAIRDIIINQKAVERVMVLGTGGLSHWVGLPRAGEIDEAFDARVLDALKAGDAELLLKLSDEEIDEAGNGAHELRSWLVVCGATLSMPFTVLAYEPVPAWLTGTCVAQVDLGSQLRRKGGI